MAEGQGEEREGVERRVLYTHLSFFPEQLTECLQERRVIAEGQRGEWLKPEIWLGGPFVHRSGLEPEAKGGRWASLPPPATLELRSCRTLLSPPLPSTRVPRPAKGKSGGGELRSARRTPASRRAGVRRALTSFTTTPAVLQTSSSRDLRDPRDRPAESRGAEMSASERAKRRENDERITPAHTSEPPSTAPQSFPSTLRSHLHRRRQANSLPQRWRPTAFPVHPTTSLSTAQLAHLLPNSQRPTSTLPLTTSLAQTTSTDEWCS